MIRTLRYGRSPTPRLGCVGALVIAGALMVTGCGSSDGSDTRASGSDSAPKTAKPATPSLAELYEGVFTTPPDSGPKIQPDQNLWVIPCASFVAACGNAANAAAEAAKTAGWKATVFDPRLTPSRFGEGLRQAVAARADGVILVGIDCNQVKQALVEAQQADVKVISLYGLDCDDPNVKGQALFSSDISFGERWPNYAAFVKDWGAAKARYLVETLKGNVKTLQFDQADSLSLKYEREGFEQELAKCKTCEIVGTIRMSPAEVGNPTVLRQKTSSALQQYPGANAIWYLYDSLALTGPATAIVESGRELVAVGGEGEKPNIDLIRAGKGQTAAMAFPIEWAGWSAVDTMNRVLAGDEAVPEGIGFQAVDREHNMPPRGEGWEPSVDYKGVYKRVWGVG